MIGRHTPIGRRRGGVNPVSRRVDEERERRWSIFGRSRREKHKVAPQVRGAGGEAVRKGVPPEILKQVKLIELRTRGLVNSLFTGEYRSVFKGQGMEFSEVREYQPGDEVRTIDWNVTARMRRPFVKRYIEERELTVMLAVDLSGSERFGTVRRFKSEMATELGAVLAMSAAQGPSARAPRHPRPARARAGGHGDRHSGGARVHGEDALAPHDHLRRLR